MADSRRASKLHMKEIQRVVENQTRVIQFMGCILASLLFTHFLKDSSFQAPQIYVLFLLFFSIGLWITEAVPPFAVGIMIVGFLVFFLGQPDVEALEGINVQKFVNTWSNSVIWLLLGGFFLAQGMRKTGLDLEVFKLAVSRFGKNPTSLLLALMIGTALASMVMSNTATTAMMIASVTPLINQIGRESNFSKAVLLGVPAAASFGGMGTIIGSPPNAIAVDTINRIESIPITIGFFEWMIFGVPVALLLTLLFWFVLIKRFKPRNIKIDLSTILSQTPEDQEEYFQREQKARKRIVLSVLSLTIFLWLTDGLHPIPMAAVSGIPIIALTMLNIITGDDVRNLPWDTLMLVAGSLSLGLAIQETGLASFFIEKLQNIHLPAVSMLLLFALTTVFASNIMSNTAAAAILIPAAGFWEGINPITLPLVIGLCASCALFLPVSTPPNAIAFSTGMVNQSDFRLGGLVAGIIGPVFVILWTILVVSAWI